MKKGLKKLVGKITEGDEYGIYRQNDEGHQYLMFAVSTYREAIKYGPKIARVLGVGFLDYLPVPEHPEAEEEGGDETWVDKAMDGMIAIAPTSSEKILKTNVYDPHNPQHLRPKPKRVSGVAKIVFPMINEGLSNEDIFQKVLPKYLEVGRTEKEARELILAYVKDLRKNG